MKPVFAQTAWLFGLLLLVSASSSPALGQDDDHRPHRSKPSAATSKTVAAAQRIVITADAPPTPMPAPVVRGRTPMARDAYGNLRRADEPRFVTGSFIPQRFTLHDNDADTATPVSIFSAGDFRKNPQYTGLFKDNVFGASYSDMEFVRRKQVQAMTTAAAGGSTVHVVDLRGVVPEKRRAALAKLLGAKRADRAIAETLALQNDGGSAKSR